jgi:hypothetical protein
MIVREDGASLWLITQPDHAGLAADLMAAWRADGLPDRPSRDAVMFATAQHDLGWTPLDAAPTVDPDRGRPVDFIAAAAPMKQQVWPGAVARLAEQSTYAAALVAQHALTIYRRFRGDAGWRTFFDTMEAARDRWFSSDVRPDGTSGGPIDPPVPARLTFLQDYATLRTGDLLSLTFCNGWTEREHAEGYTIALRGRELTVAPDAFGGAHVPFRVRARRIPARGYASDDELRAVLAQAPDEFLTGTAIGREEDTRK